MRRSEERGAASGWKGLDPEAPRKIVILGALSLWTDRISETAGCTGVEKLLYLARQDSKIVDVESTLLGADVHDPRLRTLREGYYGAKFYTPPPLPLKMPF